VKRIVAKPGVQLSAGRYLTFRIARLDFAIQAACLRGILAARELRPAVSGDWTCGFARVRGRDIPVVDLRGQLDLPHGTYGRHPCIIVVEIGATDGARLAGFIADRVGNLVHTRERDFLHGKLRFGGRSLRVLDPQLLSL
jgi:chemotaxis signal transduction protein